MNTGSLRALAAALTLSLLCGMSGAVRAQQPVSERYNSVDIQVDVQREVSNDILNATMYAEAGDTSAAQVASTLNRVVNEALKIAGEAKAVRTRSGNNQTWPIYDRNQKMTGWRGRAELRLESRDFQAAAALIGKLQSTMQLGSMSFGISPDARKSAENELITEAIAAFRARADIVRQAMAGKSYKLRRVAINTGGIVPPRPFMARAMASAQSAEVVTPQFEGGISQVTVTASGTIEIE